MKIIGIIAEYNPFHNGHVCQIDKIKRDLGADCVVVAMSGDFVQRGEPALVDKYARARMALSCGADLVVELPVVWAASSAENFAMAGVTLFEKMGCVDGICFGAESNDLTLLTAIADILADEPEDYKHVLAAELKAGKNFPSARAAALKACLGSVDTDGILTSPNNILALEYLKAIRRRHSSLAAYPIKREGAGYHDTKIAASSEPGAAVSGMDDVSYTPGAAALPTASASGIRNFLAKHSSLLADASDSHAPGPDIFAPPSPLASAMPGSALSILKEYCASSPLVTADACSAQLGYRLLLRRQTGYADIMDCNEDISNRMIRSLAEYNSFCSYCETVKTRDITYTRMSRILTHLLLGIDKELETLGKQLDYIPYLRILGLHKNKPSLFSVLKEKAHVPLISKLSKANALLSKDAMALLEKDIFAADFYEQMKVLSAPNSPIAKDSDSRVPSEYERQIVILP